MWIYLCLEINFPLMLVPHLATRYIAVVSQFNPNVSFHCWLFFLNDCSYQFDIISKLVHGTIRLEYPGFGIQFSTLAGPTLRSPWVRCCRQSLKPRYLFSVLGYYFIHSVLIQFQRLLLQKKTTEKREKAVRNKKKENISKK